jgi:soluble lytic murein transglycosylase-like protein
LIAAVSAFGLGLSVAGQAIGAPAHPDAKQRSDGSRQDASRPELGRSARAHLALFDKPSDRFHNSLEVARRQVRRAQAARSRGLTYGGADGVSTPESVGVSTATLTAIASCESGGDPAAISADGAYRGKYQFDSGTWASVGGSGDPAAASEAEQDYRAALLYARAGSSPWPNCG